ncbi:hypothetical protein TB1_025256 [Malus domestica]
MGKEDPNAGKVAIFELLNVFSLVYDMVAVFSIKYAGELAAALAASKGHPLQNETDAGVSQGSQGGGHDMLGYAFDDIEMMKVRAERGGRAGGWSGEISRKRALEEAFSSFVSSASKMDAANHLFLSIKNAGLEPDETTYRSMTEGWGRADNYKETERYYKELKRLGYKPPVHANKLASQA